MVRDRGMVIQVRKRGGEGHNTNTEDQLEKIMNCVILIELRPVL